MKTYEYIVSIHQEDNAKIEMSTNTKKYSSTISTNENSNIKDIKNLKISKKI